MGKTLIVSKNPEECEVLLHYFKDVLQVERADFDEALTKCSTIHPIVVIIHGGSTGEQAELTAQIRAVYLPQNLGILIMACASNHYTQRLLCDSGADNWVIPPFDFEALRLHTVALLRQIKSRLTEQRPDFTWNEITIKPSSLQFVFNESAVDLEPTQMKLLLAFVDNEGQLITRSWLRKSVWGNSKALISERSIDAQISKLRKLHSHLSNALISVHGKGYMLVQPTSAAAVS